MLNVRDHDNLLEVGLNGLDRLPQAILPRGVLGPESLVDEQDGQGCAGPACQQFRQGDAQREIDSKCLTAAECLVAAGTDLVGYFDVQLLRGYADASLAPTLLDLQFQEHTIVSEAAQQLVRVLL